MGLKEREPGWEDTPLTEEENEIVDYIFAEVPAISECPVCYHIVEPLQDFINKSDNYFHKKHRKEWKVFIAGLVDLVHKNTRMQDLLIGGKTK